MADAKEPRVSDEWLDMNKAGYGSVSVAVNELIAARATIASQAKALAAMKAECERLDAGWTVAQKYWAECKTRAEAAEAALKAAQDELRDWRECAKYDTTMDGSVFKGWDRSALDRLRLAALTPTKEPAP